MPDLFDFGGNPITPEAGPIREPEWRVPRPSAKPAARPPAEAAPPAPRRGLVASFACMCGCQAEILEPAPPEIRCWGEDCGRAMYRWQPREEPPAVSARPLSSADLLG